MSNKMSYSLMIHCQHFFVFMTSIEILPPSLCSVPKSLKEDLSLLLCRRINYSIPMNTGKILATCPMLIQWQMLLTHRCTFSEISSKHFKWYTQFKVLFLSLGNQFNVKQDNESSLFPPSL